MYKNPTDILVDATKLPAAIEARLPAGAPKLSATLLDIAGKLPVVPDFPMEIPALPEIPTLPEAPALPGALKRYVTGAEVKAVSTGVTPVTPAPAPKAVVPLYFE